MYLHTKLFTYLIIILFYIYFVSATAKIQKVTLRSENLTCLEILQLLNKHISSLAPVELPPTTLQTKSDKKKTKTK